MNQSSRDFQIARCRGSLGEKKRRPRRRLSSSPVWHGSSGGPRTGQKKNEKNKMNDQVWNRLRPRGEKEVASAMDVTGNKLSLIELGYHLYEHRQADGASPVKRGRKTKRRRRTRSRFFLLLRDRPTGGAGCSFFAPADQRSPPGLISEVSETARS